MARARRLPVAYAFLLPSALVLAVFTLWPIVQALWISLHDWSFLSDARPFLGLDNYAELVGDARFWNAVRVTALYAAGAVPLQIVLALAVALALNERLRGLTFLRAAYFLPVISSLAIMAIVWSFLLDPDVGVISAWMADLGLRRVEWLRRSGTCPARDYLRRHLEEPWLQHGYLAGRSSGNPARTLRGGRH